MKAWKKKLISIFMMLLIVTLNGSVVLAEDDKKKDSDYSIQNMSDGKYNEDGTISIKILINFCFQVFIFKVLPFLSLMKCN